MLKIKSRGVPFLVLGCLVSSCTRTQENPPQQASSTVTPVAVNEPTFGKFSLTPSTGQGKVAIFTLTLTRTPNDPSPTLIGLLVNVGPDGSKACYVFHRLLSQETVLVNDNGEGSKKSPTSGKVGNGQCELLADETTSVTSATQILVKFHIAFHPSFKGPKILYAIAQNEQGLNTGLQSVGQYIVE